MDHRRREIESMLRACGVTDFKILREKKHYVYELLTPFGTRKMVMSKSPKTNNRTNKNNRSTIMQLMTNEALVRVSR